MRNKVLISKVSSKSISKELRSKVTASPTAQAKYTEFFENDNLEWNEIFSLPFNPIQTGGGGGAFEALPNFKVK